MSLNFPLIICVDLHRLIMKQDELTSITFKRFNTSQCEYEVIILILQTCVSKTVDIVSTSSGPTDF